MTFFCLDKGSTSIQGDKPHQKIFYSLFSRCLIDEKEGYLEVRFDADLKPHFLDLKERFTQYSLGEFMRLPSTYSQRMFEVLSSWRNMKEGEVTISMGELHEQLDSPPSQRKNFTEFRERVLDQAQKDIMANPDSSLDYEWEAVKQGRKVISVRFIFDRRKVEKEREAKKQEAQKLQSKLNNELYLAAHRCAKSIGAVNDPEEQWRLAQKQAEKVCFVCRTVQTIAPCPRLNVAGTTLPLPFVTVKRHEYFDSVATV